MGTGEASVRQVPRFVGLIVEHGTAVLTISGLLVYGWVRLGIDAFYSRLGVTPEEVGLTYAAILSRAALGLIAAVTAIVVAATEAAVFVWAGYLLGSQLSVPVVAGRANDRPDAGPRGHRGRPGARQRAQRRDRHRAAPGHLRRRWPPAGANRRPTSTPAVDRDLCGWAACGGTVVAASARCPSPECRGGRVHPFSAGGAPCQRQCATRGRPGSAIRPVAHSNAIHGSRSARSAAAWGTAGRARGCTPGVVVPGPA